MSGVGEVLSDKREEPVMCSVVYCL